MNAINWWKISSIIEVVQEVSDSHHAEKAGVIISHSGPWIIIQIGIRNPFQTGSIASHSVLTSLALFVESGELFYMNFEGRVDSEALELDHVLKVVKDLVGGWYVAK